MNCLMNCVVCVREREVDRYVQGIFAKDAACNDRPVAKFLSFV